MKNYKLFDYTDDDDEHFDWLINITLDDGLDWWCLSDEVLNWLDENCDYWSFNEPGGDINISFDMPDDETFLAFMVRWSPINHVTVYKVIQDDTIINETT